MAESRIILEKELNPLSEWLVDIFPDGSILTDCGFKIIRCNPSLSALTGMSLETLENLTLDQLISSEQKHIFDALKKKIQFRNRKWVHQSLHLKRGDGSYLPCTFSITSNESVDGLPENYYVIIRERGTTTESDFSSTDSTFQLLLDNIPLAIAVIDLEEFRITEVSKEGLEFIGYNHAEFTSLNPLKFCPTYQSCGTRSELLALQYVEQTFKGEKPVFEWMYFHKDGTKKYAEISLVKMDSKKPQMILMARDITDHKNRERELSKSQVELMQSENRFRLLFDGNPLMMMAMTEKGTILTANRSLLDQLGYTEEEIIGQSAQITVHPEDLSWLLTKLAAFLETHGDIMTFEIRKQSKAGETIWVRENIYRIDWPGEENIILVSCENLTQQRQNEILRQRIEDRYRSIFENYLFGVFITDEKGNIKMMNPAITKLLGYDESTLMHANLKNITQLEDRTQLDKMYDLLHSNMFEILHSKNQPCIRELNVVDSKHELVPIRLYATIIRDRFSDESTTMIIVQDMSLEKKLQLKESQLVNKQLEIDHKNRELTSYTLFITQKNQLLSQISDSLDILRHNLPVELQDRVVKLKASVVQHINNHKDWQGYLSHFQEVNPTFLDQLKKKHTDLTQKELKHCAYIRMRLSVQDVADLLHITPKAVEMARYRIKKKFNLNGRDEKLSTYLEDFT